MIEKIKEALHCVRRDFYAETRLSEPFDCVITMNIDCWQQCMSEDTWFNVISYKMEGWKFHYSFSGFDLKKVDKQIAPFVIDIK